MALAAPGRTLAEVLAEALASDPGIRLLATDEQSAEASQLLAASAFDSELRASAGWQQVKKPLVASGTSTTESWQSELGWQRLLRSGLSIEPALSLSRQDAASSGATTESRLAVALRQPLLAGRRQPTATVAERGAALELSAARRELLQGVAERLAGVASRYWELAAAEQSLAILRAAEERSGTLLATVKRQVEADLTPRAELIQLAANQVAKQADTIAGERELYAARERLALAVGAAAWPARELAAGDELPTGSPELPEAGSGELPARQGWLRRGDLLAAEDRREAAALQVAAAEDALKPRLDLLFTPSWNGLAVGSSAGDFFAAAYRDLPGPSASLSLSFTRPLGNLEARSQLLAAQAGLARAEIREELLRRSIASATAIALDAVRRDAEEVARAAEAVSLFSQAAENEEKKLKAGTSTVIDVITQRDRAAGAQLRLVGARLTLALARVELRLALGAFVVATPRGPALERVELGPLLRGGAP